MARDEMLYSGITSQSSGRELRARVNRENVAKKAQLRPYAQVVFDEIEKQKQAMCDVRSWVIEGMPEEDVKLEGIVRQRNYKYLTDLQARFNTILKSEPKEYKNETDV